MSKKKVKCRSCGADFDKKLVRCPYCGSAYAPAEEEEYMDRLEDVRQDLLNQVEPDFEKSTNDKRVSYKAKHAENMRNFGKKYAESEKKVGRYANLFERLSTKAAIILVLLIATIVLIIASGALYDGSVKDTDKANYNIDLHADEYVAEAEGYLQRGEYMDYANYVDSHDMDSTDREEFAHLERVSYVATKYADCIADMETMVLRSDNPDYHDGLEYDIQSYCISLDSFYDAYRLQKKQEQNETYLAYMEDMKKDIDASLKAYIKLSDEELEEFLNSSGIQQAVKIQEALKDE